MISAGLRFLLESAVSEPAVSSAESSSPTLGDAVDAIVDNPQETLSALGEFFKNLGNALVGMLPKIIFAVVVLIIGIIITKLVLFGLSKGLGKTKLDLTVTKFTAQVAKIVLYTLLLTIVLSMLGIPATSVVTVIGTAGVAIGLAMMCGSVVPAYAKQITAVVVCGTIIYELIGPVMTKVTLKKIGEIK